MKQLSTLLILASILVAGCARINIETGSEVAQETLQPMTFSASVLEEPEVKAAIDGLDINWSAGDEIGIFDGTAFRKFTLKDGAGTTSAVFEGEAVTAESYIAVYPYNESLSVDSYGRITGLSIPRIQTAGYSPVIMTAKCEDGGKAFTFKNALTYVKVTPLFDCNKIVFETYDSDDADCWSDLCGDAELNADVISARVIGNSGNHVILRGDIKSGASYYIGTAPKYLYKGFKVIFDALDNNLQYVRKTEKEVAVRPGRVLNLGKFGKDGAWSERDEELASSENDFWGAEHFDYRSVYDWNDVSRIAAHCRKIGSSKTVFINFMGDIDFGGRELKPSIFDVPGGMVTLMGNGHVISNYIQGYVDSDDVRHAGLLYVRNCTSLTFIELCLCPKRFDLSCGGDICGGAFVSKSHCGERISFKGCRVNGNIRVKCTGNDQAYAGGFAGMTEVTGVENAFQAQRNVLVDNCMMEGSVTAYSEDDMAYAGGFIGFINAPELDFESLVTRSRNRAAILAEGDDDSVTGFFGMDGIAAGGMVGCDRDNGGNVVLKVNSCVNDGSVTARAMDDDNAFAGGMIGCHDSDGSHKEERVVPYVSNCLNRGSISADSDDSDDNAAGMVGYCYNDDTTFRNCVDSGELSGNVCAHISGTKGSYSGICYWTKADSLPGIHDIYDHGKYEPGSMSGYKTDLAATDLHPAEGDAGWIVREDSSLDLDIIR